MAALLFWEMGEQATRAPLTRPNTPAAIATLFTLSISNNSLEFEESQENKNLQSNDNMS
jgi:hypothetical protein